MSRKIAPFAPRDSCLVYLPQDADPKEYRAILIRDDAFNGDLCAGKIVIYHLEDVKLPGFHVVRLDSGLLVVRYVSDEGAGMVKLVCHHFPPLYCALTAIVGRVTRIYIDINTGECWDLCIAKPSRQAVNYERPYIEIKI